MRFTCAWYSNYFTVIKQQDYGEKLLLHDTKILSFALMKVWKPWNNQIKWFKEGMIRFCLVLEGCAGRLHGIKDSQ